MRCKNGVCAVRISININPMAACFVPALILSAVFGGAVAAQTIKDVRPPAVLRAATAKVAAPAPADVPAPADPAAPANPAAVAPDPVVTAAVAAADGALLTPDMMSLRLPAQRAQLPRTRWQHMEGHSLWTRGALSALKAHGKPLVDIVPRDIENWCPAYEDNTDAQRRAFWVGYMSALAKYESTYKPWAVGGGGRWYGLLQILPATAHGYKCEARKGEALKNGAANLSCAVRIMAYTVNRDGVIHARDSKWRGVSADWGPMRSAKKRASIASWNKRQSYCQLTSSIRPRLRPVDRG